MAILGVGGVYTVMYVYISLVVPIEQAGGATVMILTIGTSASLFAPLVVLYDAPVPFLVMAVMMTIGVLLSIALEKINVPEKLSDNQ